MTQSANRATIVIAVLLSAVAVHLASEFLIPVALALVLVSLLWPLVQQFERWRIPAAAGATICIVGTVAILAVMVSSLGPTVSDFADEIPKSIAAARPKIASMTAAISRLTGTQRPAAKPTTRPVVKPPAARNDSARSDSAAVRLDSSSFRAASSTSASSTTDSNRTDSTIARADSGNARADSSYSRTDTGTRNTNARSALRSSTPSSAAQSSSATAIRLPTAGPSSITYALGVAGSLIGEFIEVVLLALFLLAAGSAWKQKLAQSVETPAQQNATTETVGQMREVVSRYLLVTALINVGQGVVVALALNWLGYSSPMLWGVLTFALEFVPYMGGLVVVALLIVVGLAGGRGFPLVFAGPAAYLAVTTLQNNVLSPILYGKHMKLNPTAILLSLMLWYMLWGVAGAFLAVPILAAFNVFAARTTSLKPLSIFLSE